MQLNQIFTTLLATLVTSAVALQRPAGGADGFYISSNSEDGTEKLRYIGPLNTTTPISRDGGLITRASTGPVCQGLDTSATDISNAEAALANFFGGGTSFFSKSVSMFSGDAVAYGCNYGNGQKMSSGEFLGYMQVFDAKCGNTKEGYYDLPDSKSSYGRTLADQSFC